MTRQYRFIENRRAFEFIACTMAIYTRLKGGHPETWCAELRERREKLRHWKARWRDADSLPCGHQDHIFDSLDDAAQSFYSYLNAMRLLRGRISPRLQTTFGIAIGEDL